MSEGFGSSFVPTGATFWTPKGKPLPPKKESLQHLKLLLETPKLRRLSVAAGIRNLIVADPSYDKLLATLDRFATIRPWNDPILKPVGQHILEEEREIIADYIDKRFSSSQSRVESSDRGVTERIRRVV